MELKEIRNDYLLKIGCSIKDDYIFFEKDDYDFFKKIKDRTIKISEYNVPLTKMLLNCRMYNLYTWQATNKLDKAIVEKKEGTTYQLMMDGFSTYSGDFLKLIMDKFPINEKMLNNMITVIDTSINKVSYQVLKLVERYDKENYNAIIEGKETKIRLDNETYAKSTSGTTYVNKDFMGNVYAHNSSYVSKTELEANKLLSYEIEAEAQAKAYKNFAEGKEDIKKEFVKNIKTSFLEILEINFPEILNAKDIFDAGKNVEEDPINSANWKKLIPMIKEDEIKLVKEVLDFYNLSVNIENSVRQNIINHYKKTYKCDYNEMDYKYLEKNLDNDSEIGNALYEFLDKEIHDEYEYNKKHDFTKIQEHINGCKYLSNKQKEMLENKINQHKNTDKDSARRSLRKKIFIIIGIILFLIYAVFVMSNRN